MPVTTVANGKIPNFPTPPPVKSFGVMSMPNDLVADGRSYYTEIFFQDYRSAAYGAGSTAANFLNSSPGGVLGGALGAIGGIAAGASRGGITGAVVGGVVGAAAGAGIGALVGSGIGASVTSAVRLPIPNKINDILSLNWGQNSGTQIIGDIVAPGLSQAINTAGAFAGVAINPLLFLAFNHQTFREFTFDWVLAPRNKKESQTVKEIVTMFKNASLPTRGIIMDYPLIATVKMSPKDLGGLAVFHPMAIKSVSANYTANPTPSFFENTGAPTIVTLSVHFQEIKLWYRNEFR